MKKSARERFEAKVLRAPSGCWEWMGRRFPRGYGQFQIGAQHVYAHRYAVEALRGITIPEGMQVDHLCRNKACVNPLHLDVVTPRENSLRGTSPWARRARQTHCKRGHEFTQANTIVRPNGTRQCRECANWHGRELRRRKRDATIMP